MLQLLYRLFQHQFCNPRDQLLWQIQQRHRLSKSANQQECSSRIYSNISWRDNNCFLFENILKSSKISSSFFAFGQDCKINVMSISESFCFVSIFLFCFLFLKACLLCNRVTKNLSNMFRWTTINTATPCAKNDCGHFRFFQNTNNLFLQQLGGRTIHTAIILQVTKTEHVKNKVKPKTKKRETSICG